MRGAGFAFRVGIACAEGAIRRDVCMADTGLGDDNRAEDGGEDGGDSAAGYGCDRYGGRGGCVLFGGGAGGGAQSAGESLDVPRAARGGAGGENRGQRASDLEGESAQERDGAAEFLRRY